MYKLCINPPKCAFGVFAGKFLVLGQVLWILILIQVPGRELGGLLFLGGLFPSQGLGHALGSLLGQVLGHVLEVFFFELSTGPST